MHIDRTDKIAVTSETADLACPISAFGLLLMPTSGTLTRGSSFRASKARDMSLFRFVGEIVDILAVFPQSHALIVVSAIVTVAHAMRIADEERSHLLLNTEVDDLASGFVPTITVVNWLKIRTQILG